MDRGCRNSAAAQNSEENAIEPQYEIYAIRYATRNAMRSAHFIGGDPHDAPLPMDYFVWVVRNGERVIVVDTGFTREIAAQRKRTYLRTPKEGLALLGIDAAKVKDVIITHLHYDHVGTFQDFPAARFYLQDTEMAYATGRHMRHHQFNHSFEVEDVIGMVRMVYADRVEFVDGTRDIAPGISVHRLGGHTDGLQCVRVATRRGWVVLASDSSHYYEHMEQGRCFPTVFHVGDLVDGYAKLRLLADSRNHIIPGHDPEVMQCYAAPDPSLEGIVVRLDVEPRKLRP
jgi:glyoxylase-like metal-dependent hydrolase (beta-lactamase superfamily II)